MLCSGASERQESGHLPSCRAGRAEGGLAGRENRQASAGYGWWKPGLKELREKTSFRRHSGRGAAHLGRSPGIREPSLVKNTDTEVLLGQACSLNAFLLLQKEKRSVPLPFALYAKNVDEGLGCTRGRGPGMYTWTRAWGVHVDEGLGRTRGRGPGAYTWTRAWGVHVDEGLGRTRG
ncbi:hypothetical protein TREES_T100010428 [Tupaia chinensis]|uniref:Uncharacterized protein n=1 Tax=Tupaia chinensis TaxID=246437 RepID=L9LBJ1_TUPCH|nr:hypothetical protein TREES_T100010428 [Tupaia chinensis]